MPPKPQQSAPLNNPLQLPPEDPLAINPEQFSDDIYYNSNHSIDIPYDASRGFIHWLKYLRSKKILSPKEVSFYLDQFQSRNYNLAYESARRLYKNHFYTNSPSYLPQLDANAGTIDFQDWYQFSDWHSWEASALDQDRSHQIMANWIAPEIQDGDHVLDLGCGTGLATRQVLRDKDIKLWGLDSSPRMLRGFVREEIQGLMGADEITLGPTCTFPFPNSLFNHVVCNGTFPYLTSLERTFAEIARVLAHNGRAHFSLILKESTTSNPENFIQIPTGDLTINKIRLDYFRSIDVAHERDRLKAILDHHGLEIVREARNFVHEEPGIQIPIYYSYFTVRKTKNTSKHPRNTKHFEPKTLQELNPQQFPPTPKFSWRPSINNQGIQD